MKCLLFLFTLYSFGSFIDGAGRKHIQEASGESNLVRPNVDDAQENAEMMMSKQKETNEEDDDENSNYDSQQSGKVDVEERDYDSRAEEVPDKKPVDLEILQRFQSEMAAGNQADIIGQNQHIEQDNLYFNLGRRYVPQYKYNEVSKNVPEYRDPIPERAPPELVLAVAKESALMEPNKDWDLGNDIDRKKILRTGEYWNAVWKEEVKDVKTAARSGAEQKVLGSIKAKVKPGTELYDVVSRLRGSSSRLLYIINKK